MCLFIPETDLDVTAVKVARTLHVTNLQAEARSSSFVPPKAKSHGDTVRSRKFSFVAVIGFCDKKKWRQKSWKRERHRTRCVYWAVIRSQWGKCGGGWSSSNQKRRGVPSEEHTRAWQCRNVDPKTECRSRSCSGIQTTAEGFSLLNVTLRLLLLVHVSTTNTLL